MVSNRTGPSYLPEIFQKLEKTLKNFKIDIKIKTKVGKIFTTYKLYTFCHLICSKFVMEYVCPCHQQLL